MRHLQQLKIRFYNDSTTQGQTALSCQIISYFSFFFLLRYFIVTGYCCLALRVLSVETRETGETSEAGQQDSRQHGARPGPGSACCSSAAIWLRGPGDNPTKAWIVDQIPRYLTNSDRSNKKPKVKHTTGSTSVVIIVTW